MGTVNGIYELPGAPVPPADPMAPSADVLPAYFADYERRFDLRVHRPVIVRAVRRVDDDPNGLLRIETDRGAWSRGTSSTRPAPGDAPSGRTTPDRRTSPVASCTCTTTCRPTSSPAARRHRRRGDLGRAAAGGDLPRRRHVLGDAREVRWDAAEFDTAARVAAIAGVEERVRRGEPPGSVISVTGQHWTPWARR
jgi:hypothetical protein